MQTYTPTMLERGILATLFERTNSVTPQLLKLCYTMTSDGPDEDHGFLVGSPGLSEFEGTRKYTGLVDGKYNIPNITYDAAILLKRDDLQDDRLSGFMKAVNRMTNNVAYFPDEKLSAVLIAGTTGLCYDGDEFFDNAHRALANEGGTQDNLLVGAGTTIANIQTDIGLAKAAFRKFRDASGKPFHGMGPRKFTIVAPAEMEENFIAIQKATDISSTTNTTQNFELIIDPFLFDVDDWYMFVADAGVEPLIWQDRQAAEVDKQAEGTPMWIEDRQASFGVSLRAGAGYGNWQSAMKIVN